MTTTVPALRLHPDRLLPPEPGVRSIARRLYEAVRDLPILSAHSHVDPWLLLDNEPFADPASLLVTPDHYVTRLLHARGESLADLGVGAGPLSEEGARRAWRIFCAHWDAFAGTPSRHWMESELADIFGVSV
ncbi:MAG TPA: glucuronate isomerase, partial [Propionibacteriaceae bacterium]|nr:glucuronate isomerase [Propionibacteriaceae bacterium]